MFHELNAEEIFLSMEIMIIGVCCFIDLTGFLNFAIFERLAMKLQWNRGYNEGMKTWNSKPFPESSSA